MPLNPGLGFQVCWGAQDWLRWECWVLMMVLVSVSRILTFSFCHLVIPGVICYSCLWLEIVPQVIMLTSIGRPGRLALSSEFQWSEHSLQASSPLAEKVHRYLEFRPISWPKIKARNRACPRSWVTSTYPCSPHSHLHRLDSEGSRNQDGSPRCSSKTLLGRADTSPLAGKVPGCLLTVFWISL